MGKGGQKMPPPKKIFSKFLLKSLLNGYIRKVKRILAAFIHLIKIIERFAKLWTLSAPPPGLIGLKHA